MECLGVLNLHYQTVHIMDWNEAKLHLGCMTKSPKVESTIDYHLLIGDYLKGIIAVTTPSIFIQSDILAFW